MASFSSLKRLIIILCRLIDSWPSHHFMKRQPGTVDNCNCFHDSILIKPDGITRNLQTLCRTAVKRRILFFHLTKAVYTQCSDFLGLKGFLSPDMPKVWGVMDVKQGYLDQLGLITDVIIQNEERRETVPVIYHIVCHCWKIKYYTFCIFPWYIFGLLTMRYFLLQINIAQ